MTPDRPGLWLFRHLDGTLEPIPIRWRELEDESLVLEPYGMNWPDMTLDDFKGLGTWEGLKEAS